MCTCMTLKTKDYYFGRNLDLESTFGEKVIITPRNYEFTLRNNTKMKTEYAIIGMGTEVDNYPLYADGGNEKEARNGEAAGRTEERRRQKSCGGAR